LSTLPHSFESKRIRITTIHDVKGETFDAVLLVSAENRNSKGGHYEQWLNPTQGHEEYQRFAYVACSRPRHILVIANPKMNEEIKVLLCNLGLEFQDV
jgi:DNA helicase-2/ATP-dependent DNA helicase PcrA